jgi:hypothetical protein
MEKREIGVQRAEDIEDVGGLRSGPADLEVGGKDDSKHILSFFASNLKPLTSNAKALSLLLRERLSANPPPPASPCSHGGQALLPPLQKGGNLWNQDKSPFFKGLRLVEPTPRRGDLGGF